MAIKITIGQGSISDAVFQDIFELVSQLQRVVTRDYSTQQARRVQFSINRWLELVERYEAGEATLEDLKNFDPGILADMPGWSRYISDFISGVEDRKRSSRI